MLSIRRCVCSISIMLLATTVKAAPYQYELAVGYSNMQESLEYLDSGFFSQSVEVDDGRQAQFTYYPTAIAAQNGPLAQRAFLSKASSISGSIRKDSYVGVGGNETVVIEGRYITPRRFIVGASYKKLVSEYDDHEQRRIGVELGAYLSDTSSVSISVDSIKTQHDVFSSPESTRAYTAAYRQLFNSATPNRYLAYGFDFTYAESDLSSWIQIDLTSSYYLSESLSLSAGLSYLDSDGFIESTVTFGTEYFVSDRFFTDLSVSREQNANAVQLDMVSVKLGTRF